MKKYIIHNFFSNGYNAGPKAREDINMIARDLGFEPLVLRKRYLTGQFRVVRQICMLIMDLFSIFVIPERNSLILFQVPLPFAGWQTSLIYCFFKVLKRIKKIRVVVVVIDIDTYRNSGNKHKGEWQILKIGDGVILHSEPMKEKYLSKGIGGQKLELIHAFDYLSDFEPKSKNRKLTNQVVFAGNLESAKAGFIADLFKVGQGTVFKLYGNPPIESKSPNIIYMGAAHPDKIIEMIDGSFGLVWDGHSIDTCSHEIGEYQKLNSPHKTSLYIAAGIPVIIWEEAAMAKFIEKNNLGFSIGSLREIGQRIENLTEAEYQAMRTNVLEYSKKLENGWFFRSAIGKLMDEL